MNYIEEQAFEKLLELVKDRNWRLSSGFIDRVEAGNDPNAPGRITPLRHAQRAGGSSHDSAHSELPAQGASAWESRQSLFSRMAMSAFGLQTFSLR